MIFSVFFSGFTLGLSLILPIGAQNAFVLRQGLRREHVLAVCLICALSDAALILVGVYGFEWIIEKVPLLVPFVQIGGAAYLMAYGLWFWYLAWRAGNAPQSLSGIQQASLLGTGLKCLALTFLNPHVYLDTVFLLGSLSTSFAGQQAWFAMGAMSASFCFFFALGYLAQVLTPLFSNAYAWRVLDALVGCIMVAIALSLLCEALAK